MTENSKCINDFPKEILKDKYLLLENRGKEYPIMIDFFETEIEALKIKKQLSKKYNNKKVIKANVVLANIYGMKVLCDYEEIQ